MKLNDAKAFLQLGIHYYYGISFPKDQKKGLDLITKAGELGSPNAHYTLGNAYCEGKGVKEDLKKATHHWRLAAIGGHEISRHNLGTREENNGNMDLAMKHYMIAAKSGYEDSLKIVGQGYKAGFVTKEDYASTLRAYQCSLDAMKSEQREFAAASGICDTII